MPNYNETAVTGESYQRTNRIIIDNPYQAAPRIIFEEERIINLGDEVVKKPVTALQVAFDETEVINVMNPLTNELTGTTITMGEIYALIYSVYWQKAQERDSAATGGVE